MEAEVTILVVSYNADFLKSLTQSALASGYWEVENKDRLVTESLWTGR